VISSRRWQSASPPRCSADTTSTVSSPATVPIAPSSPARSSAEATTWAEPAESGARRGCPRLPSPPPTLRARVASDRRERLGPSEAPALHRPTGPRRAPAPSMRRSLEVPRNGRLGGSDSLMTQELHQLLLARDLVVGQEADDEMLAPVFGRSPVRHLWPPSLVSTLPTDPSATPSIPTASSTSAVLTVRGGARRRTPGTGAFSTRPRRSAERSPHWRRAPVRGRRQAAGPCP